MSAATAGSSWPRRAWRAIKAYYRANLLSGIGFVAGVIFCAAVNLLAVFGLGLAHIAGALLRSL